MSFNKYINKLFHVFNKPQKRVLSLGCDIQMLHDKMDFYLCGNRAKEALDYSKQKIIFHTYWKGEFGRKQSFSVKSLLATQKSYEYEVWLWLDNDDVTELISTNRYLQELSKIITIKYYNPQKHITRPDFKRVLFLFEENENLAFRADGFRMWVLNTYGGVWFDLDIMFTKDWGELLRGDEFVYAWEKQFYANNAIIYLRKGSFINEYLAKKVVRRCTTQPWALFNYDDKNLKSLRVYPSTLFDPLWGDNDEGYSISAFEDFFVSSKQLSNELNNKQFTEVFPYSYAYHWHNLWKMDIADDSLFAKFEKQINQILDLND